MPFSENLKLARAKKSMSQLELSRLLGVAQSSIANWECGYRAPSISTVSKIADVLGVSVDALTDTGKDVPRLSADEERLLVAYRSLGLADRQAITALVETLKKARNTKA